MATAFAVFCATDGSLTFYNRDALPALDSEFEGKEASSVYIGFDTANYSNYDKVPWTSIVDNIISVSFAPEFATVKPISTKFWFALLKNMVSFNATNLNTSNVTDMSFMFFACSALTSLDVSNFNTSNVTNMQVMFNGCSKLTSLDISNFNTSNVTDMSSMFNGCSALTSLDISNFDTSNVTDMQNMFNGCSKLTSLDISNFNTSNVTSMRLMFSKCSSITSLNISIFDTSKVKDMQGMFNGCIVLKSIYVSDAWTTAAVTSSSNMFTDCTNLVGAIAYDSSKVTATYANYTTGYLKLFFIFTDHDSRFVVTGSDLNRIAEVIRKKVGSIDGLSFPEGFITALESIGIVSSDDGSGNVIVNMTGTTVSHDNGNVVIS